MQKRVGVLFTAGVLAALMALPTAYATGQPPPEPTNTQTIEETLPPTPLPPVESGAYDPGGDNTVEFVGRVTPRIVSAIVPCQIDFQIDPSRTETVTPTEGDPITLSAVTNPETAVVRNTSGNVTIGISVSAVENKGSATAAGFQLVGAPGEATQSDRAFLVLARVDETFQNSADFTGRALLTALQSPIPVAEVAPGGKEKLRIYGKVGAAGLADGYTFRVIATLKLTPLSVGGGTP